jgi:hypothetical protein
MCPMDLCARSRELGPPDHRPGSPIFQWKNNSTKLEIRRDPKILQNTPRLF